MLQSFPRRVCLQWPRLGPYHVARVAAAARLFAASGGEAIALETAGTDTTYAWRAVDGQVGFRREQVFPGAIYDLIAPSALYRGVWAALCRLDPDAVAINAYSTPDAHAALAWCRRHRRTAVVMMESRAEDAPRQPWREAAKAVLLRAFDAALAGGSPQRAYLERLGFPADAIFQPYDVVDNAFFADGAARVRERPEAYAHLPGLHEQSPFFLASGRFVGRKNFGVLLEAYAAYRAQADDPWRLVLLGDGPLRAELEASAGPGVTFAGFRQIEELPAYYGLAGAFVHPALVEPWGLVVNEAMAAGLPVVVSDGVGAAADLVREGENGFTFAPRSPASLARCLARVAAPDTDRAAMGRRAVERVQAWSPEAFAEGLRDALLAGAARADRGLPWPASLLLWGMRTASRDVKTFHAIRE